MSIRTAEATAKLTREARRVAENIQIAALSGDGLTVLPIGDPLVVEWLRSRGYAVEPDPFSVEGCYRITWTT